jgi:hypothetical protein
MENKIHAGFITKNTMIIDLRLIVPVRLIDTRIAPNVTISEDWISESVGMFFSVTDSMRIRYKMTIWEKGSTVDGSPSMERRKK